MNLRNQGKSPSSSSAELPAKRKRGRPRKDEGQAQVQAKTPPIMPAPDGVIRNPNVKVEPTGAINDDNILGQVVTGVLDGSFDAGYLLTVKVGDPDTLLRGIVFDPRRAIPITPENDVAPYAKVVKWKDIPIPPVTQTPASVSTPQPKQSNGQPVRLENQAMEIENQVPPSKLESDSPIVPADQNQSAPIESPLQPKQSNGQPVQLKNQATEIQNQDPPSKLESDTPVVPADQNKSASIELPMQSKQSNEQPVQLENQAMEIQNQGPPSKLESDTPVAPEDQNQPASFEMPMQPKQSAGQPVQLENQAMEIHNQVPPLKLESYIPVAPSHQNQSTSIELPMNTAISSLEGKISPPQNVETEERKQSTDATEGEKLPEIEGSVLTEAVVDMEITQDLNSEPAPMPEICTSLDTDFIKPGPGIVQQTKASDVKMDEVFHEEMKSSNSELVAEPEAPNNCMAKLTSADSFTPQAQNLDTDLAIKFGDGNGTSLPTERIPNNTMKAPESISENDQPTEIMPAESLPAEFAVKALEISDPEISKSENVVESEGIE